AETRGRGPVGSRRAACQRPCAGVDRAVRQASEATRQRKGDGRKKTPAPGGEEKMSDRGQGDLFAPASPWPPGFAYREAFLSSAEENTLLAEIALLPLVEAQYREWTAK